MRIPTQVKALSVHQSSWRVMVLVFLLTTVASVIQLHAQEPIGDTTSARQRDVIDLLHLLFKKQKTRTEGLRPTPGFIHWSAVPGAGYTMGNGFTVSLTGNASFYTSTESTQNISSITSVATITSNSGFSLVMQPNIWLRGNRLFLAGDYRYTITPQLNFGLGGYSQLKESDFINYRLLRVYQYAYLRVKKDFFAGAGLHFNQHNRITPVEFNGKPTAECRRYGLPAQTTSTGLSANLLIDQRRNLNNPVAGGSYLLLQYLHYFPLTKGSREWHNVIVDTRHYLAAGRKRKLAFWGYGNFTLNRPPYLELPATGSDANNNMGRGYVAGRFRGRHLIYGEAELRSPLTKNELLGAVLFANVQSVTDWPSNHFTRWHPAVGTGLRIKFNKHANTNLCIDYGFGLDGSQGIFVNLGEVF